MLINEIFHSIQGEGLQSGIPTTFIRLTGCNLRCAWCDTTYAFTEGKKMEVSEIVLEVKKLYPKWVCITGGEPLLQKDTKLLISALIGEGYKISIFTNGSMNLKEKLENLLDEPMASNISICMDLKMPSSTMDKNNLYENIACLTGKDCVKFVCSNEDDFIFAKQIIEKYKPTTNVFFCAEGGTGGKWLAEAVLMNKLDARIQVQVHKLFWGNQRGV